MTLPLQVNMTVVKAAKEYAENLAQMDKARDECHAAYWAIVYAEYPELDPDENYTCNVGFIEADVVVLKKLEPKSSGFHDFMRSILEDD